jgi:hypothetical protein
MWQPSGGRVDGALQLGGSDNAVSAPIPLDPAAGPFSVFAWVQGGGPGQVILAQEERADWLMADASRGLLMTELKYDGRTGRALCSQAPNADGDWHRVGLTWDGSNRILYVDDIEVRDTQAGLPSSTSPEIGGGSSRAVAVSVRLD